MENSTKKSGISQTALLVVALATGVLGFFIGRNSIPPVPETRCPAPTRAEIVNAEPDSFSIQWQAASGATDYLILLRDSANRNEVFKSVATKFNQATFRGLEPSRRYYAEVYTLCNEGSQTVISGNSSETSARTSGYIGVTDEVPHFNGTTQCPMDCNTDVQLRNNCFDWGAGTEYYRIEITNLSGVVVRAFLEKRDVSNGIHVKNYIETPCGQAGLIHRPSVSGCATPANKFCGTIPGSTPVNYEFVVSSGTLCVNFLPPADAANFTVVVKKCSIAN